MITSGHLARKGFGGDTGRYPAEIKRAMCNPHEAIAALDVYDAEDSLLSFTGMTWHELEPKRPLVTGWALDAIVEHLEAVEAGHIKRLLMNVPPGFMKSMQTSVFFPAWCWGPRGRPDLRFICASYSQALTLRDNRRCRQLIASPTYQRNWGDRFTISPDQDTKSKFENTDMGWKLATSVGGSVVGERGDVFIIDDPHNIKDGESDKVRDGTLQWFTEIVPTRVNDADESAMIVIMQRVHQNDVAGLIIAKELGYDLLCVPMEYEHDHPVKSSTYIKWEDPREEDGELAWPERFNTSAVDALKKNLRAWGGTYAEAGQLQQRPSPRGGGMFKSSWWRFYRTEANDRLGSDVAARPAHCWDGAAIPKPDDFEWMLLSVDAAFKDLKKNSRVSCQVVAGRGPYIFVLDNITDHLDFLKTCDTIAKFKDDEGVEHEKPVGGLLHKWGDQLDQVLIEDKANGSAVIAVMSTKISGVIGITPKGGKESRASAILAAVRSGHVLLPDGAPWLDDYVGEFAEFPVGNWDDQVDALSQAIIFMVDNEDILRAIWMSNL